jgi:hypothetical protein
MSSPRRTAKTAGGPKTAPRAKPAHPPAVGDGPSIDAKRLAAELERDLAEGRSDRIAPEALQVLLAALCKIYSAQVDAGGAFLPVPGQNSLAPTDVMITASGLLRSANLAVFELGMWQSWTGR